MKSTRFLGQIAKNRGVALFISLVLLLVLTIIGVSAVQTTSLETRMARNEHDSLLAFQAAESALRDGETAVEGVVSTAEFTDTGAGGKWTVAPLGNDPRWMVADWSGAGTVVAPTAVADVAAPPRYMIEHVASVVRQQNAYQLGSDYATSDANRVEMFRVTALGIGGSTHARVMLQTTYGRILE